MLGAKPCIKLQRNGVSSPIKKTYSSPELQHLKHPESSAGSPIPLTVSRFTDPPPFWQTFFLEQTSFQNFQKATSTPARFPTGTNQDISPTRYSRIGCLHADVHESCLDWLITSSTDAVTEKQSDWIKKRLSLGYGPNPDNQSCPEVLCAERRGFREPDRQSIGLLRSG